MVQVWDSGLGFWFEIQILDPGFRLRLGIHVWDSCLEFVLVFMFGIRVWNTDLGFKCAI